MCKHSTTPTFLLQLTFSLSDFMLILIDLLLALTDPSLCPLQLTLHITLHDIIGSCLQLLQQLLSLLIIHINMNTSVKSG